MGGAHHFVRERHYVRGNVTAFATDVSVPRFAHDDAHVEAIMTGSAGRGFSALSERRLGEDKIAVCLPLVWSGARA
ncbi:hypothetical protein LJR164_001611 [Phenylobacterium sp. LjRoot164]|uniref:hypothetical protein n=1 Tax=unclassified Phenylobacterium TaxID=2640670 RepID=UPI003ECEE8EE